jgi:hypothetical protein
MKDRALRGRRPGRLSRAAGGDAADPSHRPPRCVSPAYTIGLHHGIAIIGLYIVASCGLLLASGFRDIVYFGLANVVAVVILARLCADGFASLWCS